MTRGDRIIKAIFRAIDDVNQLQTNENQLEKSADTVLFGRSGQLDSLGLVNLIVAVEQRIEEEFGTTITLTDEKAISQYNSLIETVARLADYITYILEE